MIVKVFALALVEQTGALCYPCQSSAIAPEVFPQSSFALLVQLGGMKNHGMKFSLMDIITHDFMGGFIYMNTGHFRINAKAKSKKLSTVSPEN